MCLKIQLYPKVQLYPKCHQAMRSTMWVPMEALISIIMMQSLSWGLTAVFPCSILEC